MASDATRLSVVDLDGQNWSNLRPLDVEEAGCVSKWAERSPSVKMYSLDVVSSNMADRKEQHGVGDLTMEPQVLIQGDKPELWPEPPHQRPTYWQQDKQCVERQDQPGTSGYPHGKLQCVETRQARIGRLLVPACLSAFTTSLASSPLEACAQTYHPYPNRKM